MMLPIFSCASWPSVCPCRNVYVDLLPFFWLGFCCFVIELHELFVYFGNKSFVCFVFKCFVLSWELSFWLVYGFLCWAEAFKFQFSSVAQSCPTLCDPMNCNTPGLPVHHQLPEFMQTHPLGQWCHPAISSSVIPFSSCPQSLPASGSFPMSQLFTWGGQSTGVSASASASVLPMNT